MRGSDAISNWQRLKTARFGALLVGCGLLGSWWFKTRPQSCTPQDQSEDNVAVSLTMESTSRPQILRGQRPTVEASETPSPESSIPIGTRDVGDRRRLRDLVSDIDAAPSESAGWSAEDAPSITWFPVNSMLAPACDRKTIETVDGDTRTWLSESEYAMAALRWLFGYEEWMKASLGVISDLEALRAYLGKSPYRLHRVSLSSDGMAAGLAELIAEKERRIALSIVRQQLALRIVRQQVVDSRESDTELHAGAGEVPIQDQS